VYQKAKSFYFIFQGSISNPGDGIAIARSIVNTALGTSAAGLCTLIFNKTGIVPGSGQYYSFLVTMNGSLTGKYSKAACCDQLNICNSSSEASRV
jgi:hypothetical protein